MTYSGAGQGRVYFDCSNIINHTGGYQLTFQPSKNTGASNEWFDLTYINQPKGGLSISGTEYTVGDLATIFVQLRDNQGLPINNGSCFLDVYSPLFNGTHLVFLKEAAMLNQNNSNGLYYYDLITPPSTTGTYMLSASCAYAYDWVWFYPPDYPTGPVSEKQVGSWDGDTLVLNDKTDNRFEFCTGTLGAGCTANYSWTISGMSNVTNIILYWSGQSDKAPNLTFSYWNGTRFIQLPNTLVLSATALSISATSTIDEFLSNNLPTNAIINQTVKIRLRASLTGTVHFWNNWLSLAFLSATGTLVDLKGSGELHVTNATSTIIAAISNTNATLHTKLDGIQVLLINNLTQIRADINQLQTTMVGNFTLLSSNIQSNFTRIDASLNTIELNLQNNFTNIQNNFNTVNSNIATVQTSLENIRSDLNGNFTNLNASITEIQSLLAGLETITQNLEGNLTNINSNISMINSNISTLTLLINNLTASLSNLTNIQLQLTNLQTTISEMQASVNDDFDELIAKVNWVVQKLQHGILGMGLG
jgi:predicted  nucleic acid-binding Zn-ribbon protein